MTRRAGARSMTVTKPETARAAAREQDFEVKDIALADFGRQ